MAEEDELNEEILDDAALEEGEDSDGEGGKKKGKKKSKKKLIVIAAGLLILLSAIGAGLFFMGIVGGSAGSSEETEATAGQTGEKHYYALPEYLVNLNTSSRQSSFLKMSIILELVSEKDEALIEANLPRINDSFNTYLRELRPSDLYGSAGLYRLREQLLDRVNKIIAPAAVNDILFKQVLIQ